MESVKKSLQFGAHTVTIETGEIARQASGAVVIDMAGTVVLVTAVGNKDPGAARDFFPLTVDYQEKAYAAGKIPGSFFRREGRPSEQETLTARLIDRPLRPLFPKGFRQEVQVICTVLSLNPDVNPELPSLIGASAALALSGMPFGVNSGPIGAARVGYIDGQYVLNPTSAQIAESRLDLTVAGTERAVLMVESEADALPEDVMLGAVVFGHEHMQPVIDVINELKAECGKPDWDWRAPEENAALTEAVEAAVGEGVREAYRIADKLQRQDRMAAVRAEATEKLCAAEADAESAFSEGDVLAAVAKLEKTTVRGRILAGERRIDGRATRDVRNISVRTGVLPRTHGSALFTRGETQALVVATLGTQRDAQMIDALEGERKEPFMFHYNFPPFSVGETGRVGSPKRREIGHGRLAKRGIAASMPDMDDFPYSIRVVSEITESNGSSSMASVCGSSLALMDAGVPMKAPVSGVAMGLIKEDDRFAVLTDIMGDEDHLGDMDFKVAGPAEGVNALQMDIKIDGITQEIMQIALDQAREGRLHILGEMNKVIAAPREEMSDYAPRVITFRIDPDKIRDVIGKGGSTIRSITERTGASVDINDNGDVQIFSADKAKSDEARRIIEEITADVEPGRVYEGKVAKIMDFGAFVTILPGKDGLVHISQISHRRVAQVSDELSEGDTVQVKVLEVDKQGRIRLSMKALIEEEDDGQG